MYKEDTIAAVATPVGEGGVAIIRISGPEAEQIAKEIFFRNGGKNGHPQLHGGRRGGGALSWRLVSDAPDPRVDSLVRRPTC